MNPILHFDKVTKRFGDVLANDDVTFSIAEKGIHGIVGENGAGKSTIMKVAYGLYPADSGSILFNGQPTHLATPLDAIALGIGMVHQHFMLVPTLTAWENIILGYEGKHRKIHKDEHLTRLTKLNDDYGFTVPMESRIEDLSVGIQQQVEILKLLYRNANVLIFDEPTAVLSPQEVEALFGRLKSLNESGKTIILITHKLKEILSFTHTVTVMRQGKVIETAPTNTFTESSLAEKIIGRKQESVMNQSTGSVGKAVLEVSRLFVKREDAFAISDLSFQVRESEIVGIAGIEGNGQHELVEALAGARPYHGNISLMGETSLSDAYPLRQKGFALIPPDRHREAIVLDFTVEENLILSHHWEKPYLRSSVPPVYSMQQRQNEASQSLEMFDVRPRNPAARISSLSGGNQQKAVIARELKRPAKFLLAAHPTRGVDIGAIEFIHRQFCSLKARGTAILLISSELDEILTLADRILVLYRGRIQGEVTRDKASESQLGLWMTGARA